MTDLPPDRSVKTKHHLVKNYYIILLFNFFFFRNNYNFVIGQNENVNILTAPANLLGNLLHVDLPFF